MLQFATSSNKRYTSTEQVQLALKGGCMWVRLTGKVDAEEAEPAVKMCTDWLINFVCTAFTSPPGLGAA